MGFFSRSSDKTQFPWVDLTSEEQLENALSQNEEAVFIFKHSTRCSISTMAKSRLEREWETPSFPFRILYLDLLNYRSVSNKIEELTGVQHQSPQMIVWQNGQVVYHASHNSISAQESINALTI
jgi:bacillithiol system protein YtxJ